MVVEDVIATMTYKHNACIAKRQVYKHMFQKVTICFEQKMSTP